MDHPKSAAVDRRSDPAEWDEWLEAYRPEQAGRSKTCIDRTLLQQCCCFALGMAMFIPLGLRAVGMVRAQVEELAPRSSPQAIDHSKAVGKSVKPLRTAALPVKRAASEPKAKKRFLALNTKVRLSLFPLNDDGSISPKPAEVLPLKSVQDPGLEDSFQGSQLVVHPRLNVLYECSLDATLKKLRIQAFSVGLDGALSKREPAPVIVDLGKHPFRGNGFGVSVCLDPTGTYLYLAQGSWGGLTGQAPEITFYRLDSDGAIDGKPRTARLNLPLDKYYSIGIEAGRPDSNDLYLAIAPCQGDFSGRTFYHCEVQADGSLKMDSQVYLSGGGNFKTQSSEQFLRDANWGRWEGLHLDDQGCIVEAYSWSRPAPGFSLYELDSVHALGILNSKNSTTARVFDLDPDTDRPETTELRLTVPRFYQEVARTLTDPQTSQVLFFHESANGIEMVRVGLQNGRLRYSDPQKLDDSGFLTSSCGKVQIISLH